MIKVLQGDITILACDAVVNAANCSLLGGGGVDGAIHRAAGGDLLKECGTLGGCPTGEAKVTKAYNLPCRYIIHAVGPVYTGGQHNEGELLRSCYRRAMELAIGLGVKHIAFPCISAGAYAFPKVEATQIALDTLLPLAWDYAMDISFVCYKHDMYTIYLRHIGQRFLFAARCVLGNQPHLEITEEQQMNWLAEMTYLLYESRTTRSWEELLPLVEAEAKLPLSDEERAFICEGLHALSTEGVEETPETRSLRMKAIERELQIGDLGAEYKFGLIDRYRNLFNRHYAERNRDIYRRIYAPLREELPVINMQDAITKPMLAFKLSPLTQATEYGMTISPHYISFPMELEFPILSFDEEDIQTLTLIAEGDWYWCQCLLSMLEYNYQQKREECIRFVLSSPIIPALLKRMAELSNY